MDLGWAWDGLGNAAEGLDGLGWTWKGLGKDLDGLGMDLERTWMDFRKIRISTQGMKYKMSGNLSSIRRSAA